MSESEDTRKLCRELEKFNALTYPIVASQLAPAGWPDRYVHHRKWHGYIEFKGPTTPLEKLQAIRIRELNVRVPGSAFVVRFPDRIENEKGELLAEWRSAPELLQALRELTEYYSTREQT